MYLSTTATYGGDDVSSGGPCQRNKGGQNQQERIQFLFSFAFRQPALLTCYAAIFCQILRVAACNHAAFEWIHHEHVARSAGGMTYDQLAIVGLPPHVDSPYTAEDELVLPDNHGLSYLQEAALRFADESTRRVRVSQGTFDRLRKEFDKQEATGESSTAQRMMEASAVVGGYNLVSRVLLSMDVGDMADVAVPRPRAARVQVDGGAELYALHIPCCPHDGSPATPPRTLIFVNSLMTSTRMWDQALGHFTTDYDVIVFDQRGHGRSSVPNEPCTMDQLADDVAAVLDHFKVDQAEAVIGVSQGGATTLAFAIRHPRRARKLVACDTQPRTPEANVKAWDDRIALARDPARGMRALAEATVPRWFAEGSTKLTPDQEAALRKGVEETDVEGFAKGAAALQRYDLMAQGLVEALRARESGGTLLVAGEMDGKIPEALEALAKECNEGGQVVKCEVIARGGHLPMVNECEQWCEVVKRFLKA